MNKTSALCRISTRTMVDSGEGEQHRNLLSEAHMHVLWNIYFNIRLWHELNYFTERMTYGTVLRLK